MTTTQEYTAYYGVKGGGEVPVAAQATDIHAAAGVYQLWRARWAVMAENTGRPLDLLTPEPVRIVNETLRVAAEIDSGQVAGTVANTWNEVAVGDPAGGA